MCQGQDSCLYHISLCYLLTPSAFFAILSLLLLAVAPSSALADLLGIIRHALCIPVALLAFLRGRRGHPRRGSACCRIGGGRGAFTATGFGSGLTGAGGCLPGTDLPFVPRKSFPRLVRLSPFPISDSF